MSESHQGCKVVDHIPGVELEVVECNKCGFNLGIDATYLEQKGAVKMPYPVCGEPLLIPGIE